jgi:hypothetical protein
MSSLNKSRMLFVVLAALAVSFLDLSRPFDPGRPLVQEAHAVIGRPLTPISYAGVARRTTRRGVAAGAYGASPYW